MLIPLFAVAPTYFLWDGERTQSSKSDRFSANAFDNAFYAERPAIFIQRMLFLTRTCVDLSLTSLQLENHCFLSVLINCMCATRERTFILKSYPLPCLPVSPYTGSRIVFINHLRQQRARSIALTAANFSDCRRGAVICFWDVSKIHRGPFSGCHHLLAQKSSFTL